MESERYERVLTAVNRGTPDRVPWALWGHFPATKFLEYYSWEKANRDGVESAKAHIALLNELDYKMDLLKVTPFYKYMACHWGSKFRFVNNEEEVETVDVVVKKTEDWSKLWVLDPKKELKENLRAVSILSRGVGKRMPFIYTVASPIVQALHHVSTPGRVYADMKENPDALKEGLKTITETCIDFSRTCIEEGATGIFFGIGGGGEIWSRMKQPQLEEYALYYDRMVLEALRDAPITLLHICSNTMENPQSHGGLMEEGWFKNYPVKAINWWNTSFTPLPVAKKIYGENFCIVAGLDQSKTMRYGTREQVEAEAKNAIQEAAKGGGFILSAGCTVYQDTPLSNFNAVARAAERYGIYRR
ncbi:hypothetical protein KEJ21_01110 [Candidatus Bathyarchaeota archaeon]|nr:hypothetical protein [Candidatus Bathyarchaeota archaeon]MBS7630236.1 hypothetical protein [Candidatus Bathyarchaeota archaeon]